MSQVSYVSARIPVREDIGRAHEYCWRKLAEPGTWWTGAERVAIAAEVRRARDCRLCRDRKIALSPEAVQGEHDSDGLLPQSVVDMVHRITTDPGRLSRKWFDRLKAAGLEDTHYVETLAVVARTVSIDTFCRAIGHPLHVLPEPIAGRPSRRRPVQAQQDEDAWVPLIPSGEVADPDADLYQGEETAANVLRSLSLVPEDLRTSIHVLVPPQYMEPFEVHYALYPDLPNVIPDRAISRGQMEFLASRVSALNQCFY